jgi:glycosyltransferase involved in cell wall biosynthesis
MVTSMLPSDTAASAGALVMHGELEQASRGHHVTLVSLTWDSADRERAATLRARGVDVHAIPGRWQRRSQLAARWLRSRDPLRALRFQDARVQATLDSLLATRQFDFLEVSDAAMGAYVYPAEVPSLLTEHDVRVPDGQPAIAEMLEGGRWNQFQRRIWQQFDRIQVFTEEDEAAARSLAPELGARLRVNPFGVDLPAVTALGDEEPGTVVFVGNFMHPPNVEAAHWLGRDILPRLLSQAPEASVTIVGAHPPRSVRRLSSSVIEVTGFVADVEPYLRRAAVVVAPIRTGGGMRLKVIQAMALAKPVVATSLAARGIPAGALRPPISVADTTELFASAIAELLSSDTERRGLAQRARAFVGAHRTWDAFGDRLNAIRDELLR